MVIAVYPGSFDPVTLGHVDVATRAAALFEKVIVAVYATPSKNVLFSTEERVELFRNAVSNLPNVEVRGFEGLMVRVAQDVNAAVIVRGLRSGSDFEYEYDMAFMNRRLAPLRRSRFIREAAFQIWRKLPPRLRGSRPLRRF